LKYGIAPYPTIAEAVEKERLDLVVVAVPHAYHYTVARAALAAKKHVLVEKPLTLDLSEARELIALAHANRCCLAYGEQLIFAPKLRRLWELSKDQQAIGFIHQVRQVFRTGGPDTAWFRNPRLSGGGVTLDLGSHAVECCRWLKGKIPVTSVYAQITNRRHGDDMVDEQAVLLLDFADGATAQCDVSWLHHGGEDVVLEVNGSHGMLRADIWKGMGISGFTSGQFAEVWAPNSGWVYPQWEWVYNSGYPQQLAHVVHSILTGVDVAEDGKDGLAVLEVLMAAYRSAQTGRRVDLHGEPQAVSPGIDSHSVAS